MPERVQMTRNKPWRHLHPDAVIVARPSKWGNPFKIGEDAEDAAHAMKLFAEWLGYDSRFALDPHGTAEYRQEMSDRREWMLSHAAELAGKPLACWCPLPAPGEPDHCHAAVLLTLANPPERTNLDRP